MASRLPGDVRANGADLRNLSPLFPATWWGGILPSAVFVGCILSFVFFFSRIIYIISIVYRRQRFGYPAEILYKCNVKSADQQLRP